MTRLSWRESNVRSEMKVFSSGVVLILFAAGVADFLLPPKTLASSLGPRFLSMCVTSMMNDGVSALKADYLCNCWRENHDRYDGNMEAYVRVCNDKYNAQSAPRRSPQQGGGNIDLCSGPNAALVRASGLDWCDPTIRVEPVLRPEWQF